MFRTKKAYIFTNPMVASNKSVEVTLSKFVRVISPLYEEVVVVGGNINLEDDLEGINKKSFAINRAKHKWKRVIDIIFLQIRIFLFVLKNVKKTDVAYFWIADKMLFPFWANKIKRSEINYFIYGNMGKRQFPSRLDRISSKLIRYMAGRSDYLCMESKSVLNDWEPLRYNAIRIIHLYTDTRLASPLNKRDRTLGMVCRLTPGKHVIECIRAMASVHEKCPSWRLEIIGAGIQEKECREEIEKLNAHDYIKMLGWVEHGQIYERVKAWFFLLYPTDMEGMPNGLIEMMGYGIPGLVSYVGGIRDIVEDETNGFILPDTTQNKIELGIMKIVNLEESEYQNLIREAYSVVANKYSLEAAIEDAKLAVGVDR